MVCLLSPMDPKLYNSYISTINERWKLCTFVSSAGCFILLLYLHGYQHLFTMTITSPDRSSSSSVASEPSSFNENGANPSSSGENGAYPSSLNSSSSTPSKPSSFIASISSSEVPSKPSITFIDNRAPVKQTTEAIECNIFDGKWAHKPMESPQYYESQCPFLGSQVSCQKNGRPDSGYQNWSWEADDCEIPRFNGTEMLERLRGKRVIIVGDSLNRNQWESLACLLYSVIPASRAYVRVQSGDYKVFRAKDYDCTVEFYWSPFLVQLEKNHTSGSKVLRLDKVNTNAWSWRGADIMVFNTGHWWLHSQKFRAWDMLQYRARLREEVEPRQALEMAMETWAEWVDNNVNSSRTSVFFRSISPQHMGNQWCYNVTEPMSTNDDSGAPTHLKPLTEVVERVIREMRTPVTYLNVTKLSQYRRDAHPTVYGTKKGLPPVFADCSHWCLPGVPDTWNRLLFALLLSNTSRGAVGASHHVTA